VVPLHFLNNAIYYPWGALMLRGSITPTLKPDPGNAGVGN